MLPLTQKGREKGECQLVNMDVNNAGYKVFCFMRKEIHSTCLSDLKDIHNGFLVNVNITFVVHKKTSYGTFKCMGPVING